MKRWVFRIVLFLLLGAIINVAVAWGCYLRAANVLYEKPVKSAGLWPKPAPEGWPPNASQILSYRVFGVTHIRAYGDESTGIEFQHVVSVGVPKRSLFTERHETTNNPFGSLRSVFWQPHSLSDGIAVPQFLRRLDASHESIFPTRPLWSGFIINTLFYSIVIWFLFLMPSKLRRTQRTMRGLCPKCAYPVGVSDTCTECGRPVKRKMIAQKAGAV